MTRRQQRRARVGSGPARRLLRRFRANPCLSEVARQRLDEEIASANRWYTRERHRPKRRVVTTQDIFDLYQRCHPSTAG